MAGSLDAAPRRYAYEEENNTLLRELRDGVDDIRHEVNNHESEIRIYEEKLNTMEAAIDAIRQQVNESHQVNKDLLKDSAVNTELKLNSLESSVKGLIADLKQFKNHANDSSSVLGQYKQKLIEMEKVIEGQNRNIENLQSALKSMMDALQVKSGLDKGPVADSGKTYKVKSGDNLDKIARSQGTTIQALKSANNMANDRINVGQVLKLP